MQSRLLDFPSLLRLSNLQLAARVIAEGALSGLHRAAHHGASVEFAEHKEYAPGDELRHIDWRAYGRIDKYYVKRFEEETELRCYVIVDPSGSMAYGREDQITKIEYARYLSASLSYLMLRQGDPTGLVLFGETERNYVPPHGRSAHLMDLCRSLESVEATGRTVLPDALTYLSEVARRRSLMVVISDLLPGPLENEQQSPAEHLANYSALLRARLGGLRAQHHDVIVLQTLDPDELELPFTGLTWFEDLESAGSGPARLFVDPGDVRAAYLNELQRYLGELRHGLRDGDVEYHLVSTSRSLDSVILDLLRGPLRRRIRR